MSPRAGSAAYRLVLTALLLWTIAATTYATLRLTFGNRPAYIHVRWSPSVDDAARQRMEQRYGLLFPEPEEGRTYSYALSNTENQNVRELVLDPAVEDTHYLHRTAFRVGYFAPRLPYLTSHPAIPAALELITVLSILGGLATAGLALLGIIAPGLVRGRVLVARNAFLDPRTAWRATRAHVTSWIAGRIPGASAEAVALFRIVFGGLLLALVLRRPVSAEMAAEPSNALSSTHQLLLRIFIDAPWVADWLPAWLIFWGSLFIVGAFARTAFACLTIGVLGWATLYTTATSYHTVCALLLTLLALQWSRWGDAWSVDAWRRRADPAPRRTLQEYGYTTWAPALVLGVVYFAAAFAKMRDTGLAWILNGTVKYHFLSDSPQAMVDWGLQLGHYPRLAVALSFCAIAVETLIIVGVSARAYRYRLAAGLGALSLMSGFVLLQGIYWPAWWILLLSFLPWHLVRPAGLEGAVPHGPLGRFSIRRKAEAVASADTRTLKRALYGETQNALALQPARQPKLAIALVLALLGQQFVVSLMRIEASPVLSTYDMYSTTYGSPADYEHNAGEAYWMVGLDRSAKTHRCRISPIEAHKIERDGFTADRSLTTELLRRCFDPSVPLQQISIEASRVKVDWERWQLLDEPVRRSLTDPIAPERLN